MEPVNISSAVLGVYQNVRILATTCARALCQTMTQSCVDANNCCKPAVLKFRADIAWVFSGLQGLCISGLAGQTAKERLVNSMFVLMHGSASGSVARDLWKQHIWVDDCPSRKYRTNDAACLSASVYRRSG